MRIPTGLYDEPLRAFLSHANKCVSQRGLGRIFGISSAGMSHVLNGNWEHISRKRWAGIRRRLGLPSVTVKKWRDLNPADLAWAIENRVQMKGEESEHVESRMVAAGHHRLGVTSLGTDPAH